MNELQAKQILSSQNKFEQNRATTHGFTASLKYHFIPPQIHRQVISYKISSSIQPCIHHIEL